MIFAKLGFCWTPKSPCCMVFLYITHSKYALFMVFLYVTYSKYMFFILSPVKTFFMVVGLGGTVYKGC